MNRNRERAYYSAAGAVNPDECRSCDCGASHPEKLIQEPQFPPRITDFLLYWLKCKQPPRHDGCLFDTHLTSTLIKLAK